MHFEGSVSAPIRVNFAETGVWCAKETKFEQKWRKLCKSYKFYVFLCTTKQQAEYVQVRRTRKPKSIERGTVFVVLKTFASSKYLQLNRYHKK